MLSASRRVLLAACFAAFALAALAAEPKAKISAQGQTCVACHQVQSPAFVKEWRISKHAAKGVDCYGCHKADKGDADAMEHNGFTIAVLVTPKDCARCHAREVNEMTASHHAKAGNILDSQDNFLGEVVGGHEAVVVGCVQCHGSKVKVLAGGKLEFDPLREVHDLVDSNCADLHYRADAVNVAPRRYWTK